MKRKQPKRHFHPTLAFLMSLMMAFIMSRVMT